MRLIAVFSVILMISCKAFASDDIAGIYQNILEKMIGIGSLSFKATFDDLINREIDASYLPNSFFTYKSSSQFDCSPRTKSAGFTPFMWLIIHADDDEYYKLIFDEQLSQKWLDTINISNDLGWTALHLATSKPTRPELVTYLIKNGADVNAKTLRNWNALNLAASVAGTESSIAIMETLINNGIHLNNQTGRGNTPLMLAVRAAGAASSPAAVILLLQKGAKIDITNIAFQDIRNLATYDDVPQETRDSVAKAFTCLKKGGDVPEAKSLLLGTQGLTGNSQ